MLKPLMDSIEISTPVAAQGLHRNIHTSTHTITHRHPIHADSSAAIPSRTAIELMVHIADRHPAQVCVRWRIMRANSRRKLQHEISASKIYTLHASECTQFHQSRLLRVSLPADVLWLICSPLIICGAVMNDQTARCSVWCRLPAGSIQCTKLFKKQPGCRCRDVFKVVQAFRAHTVRHLQQFPLQLCSSPHIL